jgi:hypothetical protein
VSTGLKGLIAVACVLIIALLGLLVLREVQHQSDRAAATKERHRLEEQRRVEAKQAVEKARAAEANRHAACINPTSTVSSLNCSSTELAVRDDAQKAIDEQERQAAIRANRAERRFAQEQCRKLGGTYRAFADGCYDANGNYKPVPGD